MDVTSTVPTTSQMPVVSVVMSVYNGEKYLSEAVQSILGQTFADFEFIIINDGSTDGTQAILEEFSAKDARIRLMSRENRGLTRSLNEGLAMARGEFIARIDADDAAMPERFQRQIEYLRATPEVTALGTWVRFMDEQGTNESDHHSAISPHVIAWELCMGNMIWHPTMMIRREWLDRVGNFDECFQVAQDFDLWSRIFRAGGLVAVLPEVLLRYRWSAGQISKKSCDLQGQAAIKVLRQHITWLAGIDASPHEAMCIWNLLGGGKNRNSCFSYKALTLLVRAIRCSEQRFNKGWDQSLRERAFILFFQNAEILIPEHPRIAFICVLAAIEAHPRVLLQRDLYRRIARMLLRQFPKINDFRKNAWLRSGV